MKRPLPWALSLWTVCAFGLAAMAADPSEVCPCLDFDDPRWSEDDPTWIEFANGDRPVTTCANDGSTITLESLNQATFLTDTAAVTAAGDSSSCAMSNQKIDGSTTDTFAPISAAEAAACAALLETAGDADLGAGACAP